MDFLLKFSGELLVLVLSLAVAGLNFFYFGPANFHDQSPAASLLSHYASQNPKLANKNNSIITTVAQGGLIAEAHAEDLSGLESLNAPDPSPAASGDDIVMGNEDYLLAPNPDSIQGLVEKQVKIYQTVAGDTLGSVAQKFGISAQTIIWANNLPGSTIKPGWYLLIPPVDGVIVKADSNTTLPDIADTYNPERYNPNKSVRDAAADALLQKIITYNGLADESDIDAGQIVIVPGGVVAQAPKPAAPAAPKPTPKKVLPSGSAGIDVVTSIGAGYDGVNHRFPKGQCTWYVANRWAANGTPIDFGGNGKNWFANARASGYVTGSEPAPRAAVVITGNGSRSMRLYGHVAYVESINDDGTINISEYNFLHSRGYDTRTIPAHGGGIVGYIYP